MNEREKLITDLKELSAVRRKDYSYYYANLLDRTIAALQQPTPNPWKELVIDELVMTFSVRNEHENNPRQAVKDAIEANVKIALDPQVSEAAQALYDKGFAAALSQPQPLQGWVKCSEKLPELGEPVLAWMAGTLCALVRDDDGDGWLWSMCNNWPFRNGNGEWECDSDCDDEYLPTHWMPLPEPPIAAAQDK